MPATAVIVILNYNDMETTRKLADSARDYSCLDGVVVVDNHSSDESFKYLTGAYENDPRVDVIQTPSNGGYAKGNNFGINFAIEKYDPEFVFVANPDIAVSADTVAKMISAMQEHSAYAVMAPIVNQGYNVWNLPGFGGMIESLFLVWFNLDKKRIKEKLIASSKAVAEAGVVEGSFFVIRTEDYKAVEGFDERTFLYAEEIILARRLKDIGRKVGVLTKERYDHLHSASIKKQYRASKRRAFPNFYKSFCIYNRYYLKTNRLQDMIFAACYGLAYIERFFYDVVKR